MPPTAPTDPAPRFMPGRAGVTQGFLLPFAKELQFTFEEPPDEGTAEADRYHALMLLSLWEEMTEAQELAAYWAQHTKHADAQRHPDKHKPSCSRDPASFMRTAAGRSTLEHGSVTQKRVDEALARTMPARATSVRRLAALEAPLLRPRRRRGHQRRRHGHQRRRRGHQRRRRGLAVRAASKPGISVGVRAPYGGGARTFHPWGPDLAVGGPARQIASSGNMNSLAATQQVAPN